MRSVINISPTSSKKCREKKPAHCPVRKQCILATACYLDEEGRYSLNCQLEHYNRGDMIWCNRNEEAYIYTIQSGIVSIEKCSRHGDEIVFTIMYPGQSFGLTGLFNPKTRPFYAVVCSEAELCRTPVPILERLIKSDPFVAERVIRNLSDDIEIMFQLVTSLSTPHASDRVRSLLQQLAKRFASQDGGGENGWVRLPLTHQDLACLAGINRVTVTRALHQLQSDGLVQLGNRTISVLLLDPLTAA